MSVGSHLVVLEFTRTRAEKDWRRRRFSTVGTVQNEWNEWGGEIETEQWYVRQPNGGKQWLWQRMLGRWVWEGKRSYRAGQWGWDSAQ